jgi:hypothetical protein
MLENFKPKIWAATILRDLHPSLIAKQICTKEYTGEISQKGDAVYFDGLAAPTINPYTDADISYEDLQDSRITLLVDQGDYFAFQVGDIDKIQAELDQQGSQAQEAAFGLAQAADTYVMGLVSGMAASTTATVTSANVLSVTSELARYLKQANVPDRSMWIAVPPWLEQKLRLAGVKFQIKNGAGGAKGGISWTDELGFDMYVTNQVKAGSGSTSAVPVSEIMAGAYNAIVYADQLTDTETLRLENRFKTAVRGLHTYGAKIVRPKQLVRATLTFGAETTI